MSFSDDRVDLRPDGLRVPSVPICELVDDELLVSDSAEFFAKGKAVIVGVPGAFTPVCTRRHLPEFVASADGLRSLGYELLVCLCPDSPWAVYQWSKMVDPGQKLRFVSDGNLAFARQFGLTTNVHDLFLGESCKRFLMTTEDGRIDRIRVEQKQTSFEPMNHGAAHGSLEVFA